MSEYPLPGFPKITDSTIEDWVKIDGTWHSIVYVTKDGWPTLYLDGKAAVQRAEVAVYNRALTEAEVRRHFEAAADR